ncbi:hypothetical protein HK096_006249 [Nowakowskiella sp. JEL0078]|nr:hypothetical protein HK096_006249 [Nowakowskiella sp. JEL0078]
MVSLVTTVIPILYKNVRFRSSCTLVSFMQSFKSVIRISDPAFYIQSLILPAFHGSSPNFTVMKSLFRRLPNIRCLDLGSCQLTALEIFQSIHQLCEYQLETTGVINIVEIKMSNAYNLSQAIPTLKHSLLLEHIKFKNKLSGDVKKSISQISKLVLENCYNIHSNTLISILNPFCSLQSISLRSGGPAVTDKVVISLSHALMLESLDVADCHFLTDLCIINGIAAETSLCKFSLRRINFHHCDMVGDGGIIALVSGCTSLNWMDLENCNLSSLSIHEISRRIGHNLIHISVAQCYKITDVSMTSLLIASTNLKFLDISFTGLTDTALYAITSMKTPPPIQILSLVGCRQITLRGVFHLARCLNDTLEQVWIRRCKQLLVSDKVVVDLDVALLESEMELENSIFDIDEQPGTVSTTNEHGFSFRMRSYRINEFSKVFPRILLDVDVGYL